MATQEPNVYAGLSVVIGGLMHARPRFFAKVMGELLFWVGEDKMTFGSDYGIWEPQWQVEGFVDWDFPDSDDYSDYPRVNRRRKKKILGLNAAKLYDIEVPAECRLADARSRPRPTTPSWSGPGMSVVVTAPPASGAGGAGHRARPRARRAGDRAGFRRLVHVSPTGAAEVHLRLPTYFCAPNFAFLMVADAHDAVAAVPGVRAGA